MPSGDEHHHGSSHRRDRRGPVHEQVQHGDGQREPAGDDQADGGPLQPLPVAARRMVVPHPCGGQREQQPDRPREHAEPRRGPVPGGRQRGPGCQVRHVGSTGPDPPPRRREPAVGQREQQVHRDRRHQRGGQHLDGHRPVVGAGPGNVPAGQPPGAGRHRRGHRARRLLPLRRPLRRERRRGGAQRPGDDQPGGHRGQVADPPGDRYQQAGDGQRDGGERQQHPRHQPPRRGRGPRGHIIPEAAADADACGRVGRSRRGRRASGRCGRRLARPRGRG